MTLYVRDDFYGVKAAPAPVGPQHFAYVAAGSGAQLALYAGGSWVADLGAPLPVPLNPTPVILDVTGGLSPGSMVGGGREELVTSDFQAGVQRTLAVEEGWWAGPAIYVNGGIHWLERAATAPAGSLLPVRLRRANGRLENVTTLGEIEAGFPDANDVWLPRAEDPLFTREAAAFTVTSSGEVDVPVRVRITWEGEADQASQLGGEGLARPFHQTPVASPYVRGSTAFRGSVAPRRTASTPSPRRSRAPCISRDLRPLTTKSGEKGGPVAPQRATREVELFSVPGVPSLAGSLYRPYDRVRLWPGLSAAEATQGWQPAAWGMSALRAGVSANGSTVVTFGRVAGERRALHSTTNPAPSPSADFLVEPHPTLGQLPEVFWPAF